MSKEKMLNPIHPGEILLADFMEPMGLTMNGLARDLLVPPGRVSDIVRGKRSITADTALRLERYFKVSAQFWLNLETEHDLRIIKRKIGKDIDRRIVPVQNIDVHGVSA